MHRRPPYNIEPFLDQGRRLSQAINEGHPAEELPDYLNKGTTSYVFRANHGDTPNPPERPEFVIKLPYVPYQGAIEPRVTHLEAHERREEHIAPLLRGLGRIGLEQVYSYSTHPKDPALIVSRFAGGKSILGARKDGSVDRISSDQYTAFLSALAAAQEEGLSIDSTWGNYRVGDKNDLTLIDYSLQRDPRRPQSLAKKVVDFGDALTNTSALRENKPFLENKLPGHASTYREAVHNTQDQRTADNLDNHWQSRGFKL